MPGQIEPQSVQVIDRTFAVMELVARRGVMSLKDIYSGLELSKATALRIANALVSNGYFERDEKGSYSLSFKSYEIGICAVRRVEYIPFIRETLDHLSGALDVIAQFSVREQDELLCLESFDLAHSNFSVYTRVGQRSQLYATSAGKAILSVSPDEDIRSFWNRMNIRSFTPKTITNLDDFLVDIHETRQRGYALDQEETEAGLFCVGTPLVNASHKAIGAISLSSSRLDEAAFQRVTSTLLNQTQRLAYMLSYSIK